MDSPKYTSNPGCGFWVATTLMIIGSVIFVIVFLDAFTPRTKGAFVTYLSLTFEFGIVSGICIGLLQYSQLPHTSSQERMRWVGITVLGTTVGWFTVFAIGVLLATLPLDLPVLTDNIALAVFGGLIVGGSMGAIIGLATGITQARFYQHLGEDWIGNSLISWGVSIATLVIVLFAFLSQATLSF